MPRPLVALAGAALAALAVAAFPAPGRAAEPAGGQDAAKPAAPGGGVALPGDPKGDLVDGIAAQVGTEVVLVSDVERASAPIEAKMRAQGGTDADIALLRSDILDKLIERKLILLLAKRAEIQATDLEIDDAIAGIAKENGLTLDALKKSVEEQGLTYDGYRQKIREEIVQQKVLASMVRPRVKVEESAIRKLYDQRYGSLPASGGEELHLVHMAAGADDGKPKEVAAACEKIRRALARVHAGESFESVAGEVSQASPDLGWLPASALAPWMQDAVKKLEPGKVSDVIQLPIGCAVLKLVQRRTVQPLTYEQAKPQLRSLLADQAFQEEYARFIDRLRKQTYVERKGLFSQVSSADVATPPPIR
jgi:peptidyl-prolyl cis-trans isomerase SurA